MVLQGNKKQDEQLLSLLLEQGKGMRQTDHCFISQMPFYVMHNRSLLLH